MIAECHLRRSRCRAVAVLRVGSLDPPFADQRGDAVIEPQHVGIHRDIVVVAMDPELHKNIALILDFIRDHMTHFVDIDAERNQRRRHVNLVERAGHGILAADCRDAEAELRVVGAEQRRERLTPSFRVLAHSAEIFLEGKMHLLPAAARRDHLRNRLRDCVDRAVIRTPGGQVRVKPIAHHRDHIGVPVMHRELRHHGLRLRHLILAAIRHVHRCRADRGIEHLNQPPLRAGVEIRQLCHEGAGKIIAVCPQNLVHGGAGDFFEIIVLSGGRLDLHGALLMRAVGVKERAADIDHILPAPGQNQIRFLRHNRERRCFQIFFCRIGEKLIPVLRRHDDRHALLGLGDGKLSSIKALILFRNQIKIHPESVRKLSDCDGDPARAKIIALLDHVRDLRPAEQALQLPFRGRVTLLNLSAAGGE